MPKKNRGKKKNSSMMEAIGDITAGQVYWNDGAYWSRSVNPAAGPKMDIRDCGIGYYFTGFAVDISRATVHNSWCGQWVKKGYSVKAGRYRRKTGFVRVKSWGNFRSPQWMSFTYAMVLWFTVSADTFLEPPTSRDGVFSSYQRESLIWVGGNHGVFDLDWERK